MGPALLTLNRWDSVHTCPAHTRPTVQQTPSQQTQVGVWEMRMLSWVETDQACGFHKPQPGSQCWIASLWLGGVGAGPGRGSQGCWGAASEQMPEALLFRNLKTCSTSWTKMGMAE